MNSIYKVWMEVEHGNRKVLIILDDNCVRYHGYINGKQVCRKEFKNNHKSMCEARAMKWVQTEGGTK